MKSDEFEVERIKELFEQLRKMLEEHRGTDYVAGVVAAIRILADHESPVSARMDSTRAFFKTMMGGHGTLGDFAIGDGDEATQVFLNRELNKVLKGLWEHLEC